MDWFTTIIEKISVYIALDYLLIFLLLSYVAKEYFQTLLNSITKFEWKSAYSCLIIATVLAVPWLIFTDNGWIKILFSYALGTSMHELFLKHVVEFFEKAIKKLL